MTQKTTFSWKDPAPETCHSFMSASSCLVASRTIDSLFRRLLRSAQASQFTEPVRGLVIFPWFSGHAGIAGHALIGLFGREIPEG